LLTFAATPVIALALAVLFFFLGHLSENFNPIIIIAGIFGLRELGGFFTAQAILITIIAVLGDGVAAKISWSITGSKRLAIVTFAAAIAFQIFVIAIALPAMVKQSQEAMRSGVASGGGSGGAGTSGAAGNAGLAGAGGSGDRPEAGTPEASGGNAGGNVGDAGSRDSETDSSVVSTPGLRWIGRVQTTASGARISWPGTGFVARFNGTGARVNLTTGIADFFQVVIDAQAPSVLATQPGAHDYALATGLAPGEHTVTLWRRTEPLAGAVDVGAVTFTGTLLAPPPASFIGSFSIVEVILTTREPLAKRAPALISA